MADASKQFCISLPSHFAPQTTITRSWYPEHKAIAMKSKTDTQEALNSMIFPTPTWATVCFRVTTPDDQPPWEIPHYPWPEKARSEAFPDMIAKARVVQQSTRLQLWEYESHTVVFEDIGTATLP